MENIVISKFRSGEFAVNIYSDNFDNDEIGFVCRELNEIFPMFRKHLYDVCDKETRMEIMRQIDLIQRGAVPYWA